MPTFTLNDLSQRVLARLDGNLLFYPQSEITNAINEAIRVLNLASGFLQIQLAVPESTQKNRIFYNVPVGIVIPLRVQFENTYLQRLSLNSIGQAYPQWTTGTTANTLLPVTNWVPVGLTKFGIYPADSVGGKQLFVTGVQEPMPLVNPTDPVTMPNEVAGAFDLYATHVLQLKESAQTFTESATDYVSYLKLLKQIAIFKGIKWPKYWVQSSQSKEGEGQAA